MSFGTGDVQRKALAILKVLHSSQKPVGARIIAQSLKQHGVVLSERAVRYHLRFMDERGLTELVGNRDGRAITEKGLTEIKNALVKDKVSFAKAKLDLLAFRTNFNPESRQGTIPINISFFRKTDFKKVLLAMRPVFENNLCVSELVGVFNGGQRVGDIIVPHDEVGFATVCSIVTNGALLKAGVPTDSKFSGILQIDSRKPVRFMEIIHYQGCSLDPSEIFIKAGMTSVRETASTGNGAILANFREIPNICLPVAERVLEGLKTAGIEGVLVKGNISEPVCEIPVEANTIGLVFIGGLNPVAAAQEAGIEAENHSMSAIIDYQSLIKFTDLLTQVTHNGNTKPGLTPDEFFTPVSSLHSPETTLAR